MSIQKGFCLAPDAGAQSPSGYPAGDLRIPGLLQYFADTGTKWVRLIAEWEYFFPPGSSPSNPPSTLGGYLDALDQNVSLAKSNGLRVILVTRGFPKYVNGSTDAFTWPRTAEFSPTGHYAYWATSLMSRYHPANRFSADAGIKHRWIDFFEVVNEPNFEPHPQSASVANTAEIFSTAWKIATYLNANYKVAGKLTGAGQPLRLMGPATSDFAGPNSHLHTSYSHFVSKLVTALAAKAKAGDFDMKSKIFAWSHHNYNDVANLMPLKPATTAHPGHGNRAQLVRALLKGHWGGYPGTSTAAPKVYLNEGGYYRGKNVMYSPRADTLQQRAMSTAVTNLKKTGTGQPGQGIVLFTNFLGYSVSQYDSGIARPYGGAVYSAARGLKRPAYDTWKAAFKA